MIAMNAATSAAPAEPINTAPTLRYLNAAQLAELLGVNRSTIGRWAASDATMPAIRIAGTVRFRLDQVELWLAGKTQGAPRAQRRARLA
jgi:excisionase family DNA binding protein